MSHSNLCQSAQPVPYRICRRFWWKGTWKLIESRPLILKQGIGDSEMKNDFFHLKPFLKPCTIIILPSPPLGAPILLLLFLITDWL